MGLSAEESRRYARHIVLKGVGGAGQQKLKNAKVLVVGAGGLGSPVIAYLAAAGVGTIGVLDDDEVSLSNLQRQVLHRTTDTGTSKVESAARFVGDLNTHVVLVPHQVRLTEANAGELMEDYDIIVDGSDSFGTRRNVAMAAERTGKTLVTGGVSMFDGQLTVIAPHPEAANPRFCDLYPDQPSADSLPTCEQVGVIGAVTGVIGTLMAMEVIKLITGVGEPLIGRLLMYDGRDAKFTEMRYGRSV